MKTKFFKYLSMLLGLLYILGNLLIPIGVILLIVLVTKVILGGLLLIQPMTLDYFIYKSLVYVGVILLGLILDIITNELFYKFKDLDKIYQIGIYHIKDKF